MTDPSELQTKLLIDGTWREGSDNATFPVFDPSSGATLAEVSAGSVDDVVAACDSAQRAQRVWAAVAPRDKAEILRRCWQGLLDHQDSLARLITSEHGKALGDSAGEVAYAAEFFRWNAEEAVRLRGELALAPAGGRRMLVQHHPIGVVVIVTPWNFPAAMITRKLAPALAAGNAAVIKPPAETPLTALRVAEILLEAGVPDGLVNVVPTQDPGAWFDAAVDHRATRMVSFTGSTATGRLLLRRCADRILKTVMELGGNAPFVVFADADLDTAVEGAMVAKMRHSAETCTAANRFYVESSVVDAFTERLVEAMSKVVVGPGAVDGVTCGPLIHDGAVAKVDGLVRQAVEVGASVVLGGRPVEGPGSFYEPTVLRDVPPDAAITREEIFGPVAPIIAFDDVEEMLGWANDTEMGLTGYVYTADLKRGLAVSERIEAGMIGLNQGAISDPAAPFGGMKQSGLGREGSTDGILEFCETQYIAVDW